MPYSNKYSAATFLNSHQSAQLVFFSGGSAINGLAKNLAKRRCHVTYLISGFDSGGSSAQLRRSLGMPAVGDLRSRLVALIDQTRGAGWHAIARLLGHRFVDVTHAELQQIASGHHTLNRDVLAMHQAWLRRYIQHFLAIAPNDFCFKHASLGNIVLAGAYDLLSCRLDHVAYLFVQYLALPATIRVISLDSAHLVAYLDNDCPVIGQHRFTGKAKTPLNQRIDRVSLSATIDHEAPVSVVATPENLSLIKQAQLICYPPGSFFSSVIANLLPVGVSEAIAENPCPKVYVPNLGVDPEQWQLGILDQIEALMRHQGLDPSSDSAHQVLNTLVLDVSAAIPDDAFLRLNAWGITVIRAELTSSTDDYRYDDQMLANVLLGLLP